jgi:cytochrome c556
MSDLRKITPLVVLALWTIGNAAWTLAVRSHRENDHTAAVASEPDAHAAHGAPADTAAAHGHDAHAAPDTRQRLAVPAEARDAVLAEMRTMLAAMQGALEAGARGDTAAMRAAVTPAGVAMAADHSLESLLPPAWMQLAMTTHRAFDALPAAATSPAATMSALGRITASCNSCHATYRLEVR